MENNLTEDFLQDLSPKSEDPFETPLAEVTPEKEETEEEGPRAKNRRERRLLEQSQRYKEEAIAYAARLDEISKARKAGEGAESSELRKLIEPIWGTDSPEKLAATDLLEKALLRAKDLGAEEALSKYEERQSSASKEIAQEEANVEDILDVASDLGIDVDNENERSAYLALLEKASPKDKDGNITEYADARFTAETYLSLKEKSSSRAKDLASRSMVRGGQSSGSKLETDSMERYLKSEGII